MTLFCHREEYETGHLFGSLSFAYEACVCASVCDMYRLMSD